MLQGAMAEKRIGIKTALNCRRMLWGSVTQQGPVSVKAATDQ